MRSAGRAGLLAAEVLAGPGCGHRVAPGPDEVGEQDGASTTATDAVDEERVVELPEGVGVTRVRVDARSDGVRFFPRGTDLDLREDSFGRVLAEDVLVVDSEAGDGDHFWLSVLASEEEIAALRGVASVAPDTSCDLLREPRWAWLRAHPGWRDADVRWCASAAAGLVDQDGRSCADVR